MNDEYQTRQFFGVPSYQPGTYLVINRGIAAGKLFALIAHPKNCLPGMEHKFRRITDKEAQALQKFKSIKDATMVCKHCWKIQKNGGPWQSDCKHPYVLPDSAGIEKCLFCGLVLTKKA